jgi:hypothetical protein
MPASPGLARMNRRGSWRYCGVGASHSRQPRLRQTKLNVAAGAGVIRASLKLRGKSRLQLQIGAFQDNRTGVFHFIQGPSDITGFKVNSAATVDDHVRV